MSEHPRDKLYLFLEAERHRQDKRWGQQDHPNGTGDTWAGCSRDTREACEENFKLGLGTWADILLEEVYEALAESDPAKLWAELLQTAAVCVAWMEAIERQPPYDRELAIPCQEPERSALVDGEAA